MAYRRRYCTIAEAAESGWTSSLFAVAGAVAVVLVFVSAAVAETANPMLQPGTTWSRGMLSGESLRLFDSGRYVRIPFCDVCANDEISERGTWSSSDGRIRLQPEQHGQVSTVLVEQLMGTCEALVEDSELAEPNVFSAFFRDIGDCDPWEPVPMPCPPAGAVP